jgi:hypothetical protein
MALEGEVEVRPRTIFGSEFLSGLKRAGIIPKSTRKVVITAEEGKPVNIALAMAATDELLQPDLFSPIEEEEESPEANIDTETGEIRAVA